MELPRRDTSRFWINLVALLSGAICLIYQLVWSRYLHLILGVSAYAIAIVLASFMTGLALGAWHIGGLIDRSEKRVRFLIVMEAAIGMYILLSPAIYQAIAGVDSRGAQIALAIGSLLLPTYLMGGTFPAFVRIVARDAQRIGTDTGAIYAANTIGGAVGAFCTGFFLISWIGLSRTLYLAATIAFGITLMLGLFLRADKPDSRVEPKKKHKSGPAKKESLILLSIVFGICGFTGLAYEVYWTRLLSLFFKDSIYDLTIVLTSYLTGLAAGSILCAYLLRFVKRPRDVLATVLMLLGLSALMGLYLVDRFPFWINDLQTNTSMVERFGSRFWLAGNAIRFWYALLLMFAPTCLFGAVLPLVSRMSVVEIGSSGKTIGLLSGVNTFGSALGATAAGFVFIGAMGLANSIMLMAFLNVLAALLLVRSWVLRVLMLLVAVIVAGLVPAWDQLRMSSSFLDPGQDLGRLLSQEFYREDVHGITAVVNVTPYDRRYLVTNRLFTQNTSEMNGPEDHRRLGHIPMLLHPNPKTALAVGLGAGITLRGIADYPVDRIDCVEISPSVIDAAKLFAQENAHVLENPKVRLHIDDARHFMRTASTQYDVIVLDIFHPMSGGSSMIFSREYYELCRRRLAAGGMLCQWLPAHQLSMNEITTIAATIQSVFPHVSLWYGLIGDSTAVIGLIAGESPLAIDFAHLAEACNAHPELYEITLGSPDLVLSHFILADQALRDLAAGASIDTDDKPVIELLAPKLATQSGRQGVANLVELSTKVRDIRQYVTNLPPENRLDRAAAGKRALIDGLDAASRGGLAAELELYRKALESDPTNEDLLLAIRRLSEEP